jgi:hypothetical protein
MKAKSEKVLYQAKLSTRTIFQTKIYLKFKTLHIFYSELGDKNTFDFNGFMHNLNANFILQK